jgi:hypothetical protein
MPKNNSVTLEAEGLSMHGSLIHLKYTVNPGTLAERVLHPATLRNLEDVASVFGLGLCLTASLHWANGPFITLEGAQ